MDGAFDTYWQAPCAPSNQLSHIHEALSATLDPRVSNETRQEALQYLEQLKQQADAPHHGFTLAEDWKQNDAVRYYGLQLLEYAIRYRWSDYSVEQTGQLRAWVKNLAGSIREQDALYIRNKIGQLWVELAKRCWGDEWADMDKLLLTLWEKPMTEKGTANKVLVLFILETLSDDIINNEDAVAGLRLDTLGNALNEIMVPDRLHAELEIAKTNKLHLRHGDGGWLVRVCDFLSTCLKEVRLGSSRELVQSMSFCANKALLALRSIMAWMSPKAAIEVGCLDCLFLSYYTADITLQMATTEVLYVFLNRPYGQQWHESWFTILPQTLQPDRIALLRQAFEQSQSMPGEDDKKYALHKKLAEVLSVLAEAIAQHPELTSSQVDLPSFFDLLLLVLQSQSLVVSIPVLYSFTKLMAVHQDAVVDIIFQALGPLVETCSARLLRYEAILDSADSEDQLMQFLHEDFDTTPERHAFLGNYRRHCVSIVHSITRTRPVEALSHVLGQLRELMEFGPYTGGRGFDSSTYTKTSLPTLQFDAQYQVVSNALKGYSQWLADVASLSPGDEHHPQADKDKAAVEAYLQQWSSSVIDMHVDDPEVAVQILQILVVILRTVKPEAAFVLRIAQHLLTMRLYDNPAHTVYSDAVKAFEGLRVLELQKLALTFPNQLLEVYHDLEPRVGILVQKFSDHSRLVWGYKAFLFMIVHRATGIDSDMRLARLQQMLKPVYEAWQGPGLSSSLTSLQSFCESLALGDLADFYRKYHFAETADWAAQQLDEAGQAKQAEIRARPDSWPMRMTKSMLAATTEKLKSDSEQFEVASQLWSGIIPFILPNLLHMLRHAQAFYNLANWSQLPDELQAVIKRTLQDRFWQSGISNESRDEFYARITGSKTSYEGFASVVRGTMRNVREQGYHIVYLMTKFEEQFYGMPDLGPSLAEALFADSHVLSANHIHPLINLTTGLVQRCPPHHRAHFLPPLLTQLFKKLDAKICNEWEAVAHASQQPTEDDELSEEMRIESVLRHLTYSMVSFVAFLLDFDAPNPGQLTNGHASPKPALRDVVLSDLTVLEPLILFCTHALRVRDTRCCTTICRVFRKIIPIFQSDTAPAPQVREFICTEAFKACITSLNEPYFADMQKDLASLIALIIALYAPLTGTPKEVLMSLPAMSASKVDRTMAKIGKAANERQQRALVLDLLEGVRGVSIHELGKIAPKKASKKVVQQKYMEVEQQATVVNGNGNDAGLEGVAGLFG